MQLANESARINLRTSVEAKTMIERAAALMGTKHCRNGGRCTAHCGVCQSVIYILIRSYC